MALVHAIFSFLFDIKSYVDYGIVGVKLKKKVFYKILMWETL